MAERRNEIWGNPKGFAYFLLFRMSMERGQPFLELINQKPVTQYMEVKLGRLADSRWPFKFFQKDPLVSNISNPVIFFLWNYEARSKGIGSYT